MLKKLPRNLLAAAAAVEAPAAVAAKEGFVLGKRLDLLLYFKQLLISLSLCSD